MALTVATNTGALMAQAAASAVNKDMELSMERLSTGKRINSAADDAAGVAIASRLSAEIKGTNQAIRNAMDGQALIDTAEGSHQEVESILQRMRELAVQSANDSNSASDRVNLQLEIDQLLIEVDRIASSTTWAGIPLLSGPNNGTADLSFQIGSGTTAADQIDVSINATSSEALGIGSNGLPVGGRATGHASVNYKDGALIVEGAPAQGDVFTFELNGTNVSATFSENNQYSNDAAGAAAQIKDAIDVVIAANPSNFSGVTAVDNFNGTLSITQSTAVTLDTFTEAAASVATATIDEENGIITFGGTIAAANTPAFNINGTNVILTARTTTDGYGVNAAGTAAYFKAQIEQTVGMENINVRDHGDGSLTITQSEEVKIEGAEVTLTTGPTIDLTYDDTNAITVSGAFVAGQSLSFDLFGETVSFTTSSDDGFEDTLAGVASQMAAAVNNAGISGITASKTSGANSITLVSDVVSGNAVVNSGSDFIATTIGDAATSSVAISATDVAVGSATAAAYANGDAYTFEVAGHELSLIIDTSDGYTDDKAGVAQQMEDLVLGLGLEGVTVATATGTTAQINITRALTGTANAGSTVVTNITSLAEDEIGDPSFSGSIDVSTSAASSDAITRIDNALQSLNAQRANLGAISNRFDSTVSNLTNISSNLQAGRGRIEDADFAAETTSLAKSQILQQASTAMLAQANASKQNVLSLLQG